MTEHEQAERLLTVDQRVLGASVRALLREHHVAYTETLQGTRGESWYRFDIETPPGSELRVNIAVVGDVVVFEANGVELRWDLENWDRHAARWIADSVDGLAAVFRNDLRLRLRRAMFGGTTGAIWFPGSDDQGTWHGDRRAARGEGREYIFPRVWYLKE